MLLKEIQNAPHPYLVGISASFRVEVRVRYEGRRREDLVISTNDHIFLTDTLGGGEMAEAFYRTMKPMATNGLSPKMDVGKQKPRERNGALIIETM